MREIGRSFRDFFQNMHVLKHFSIDDAGTFSVLALGPLNFCHLEPGISGVVAKFWAMGAELGAVSR